MRFPSQKALNGLRKALAVAEATPAGGDWTDEGLDEVVAAIEWLLREIDKEQVRVAERNRRRGYG